MSSLPKYTAKRDRLEPAVIKALEYFGASVTKVSMAGVPDLLVGFREKTYLIEVKSDAGKLTPAQVEWHANWKGAAPIIVRSVEEAMQAIGLEVFT